MNCKTNAIVSGVILSMFAHALPAQSTRAAVPTSASESPVTITVMDRLRTDATQWYSDPPYTDTYPYVEELLRFSVGQRVHRVDWLLEGSQNTVFNIPKSSVSPVTAQGQLGLGGTYYAANNNTLPVAASFRQGFVRYHGSGRIPRYASDDLSFSKDRRCSLPIRRSPGFRRIGSPTGSSATSVSPTASVASMD